MPPRKYKLTDDEFIEVVKRSTSIRDVLTKMGLSNKGGNYDTFYRRKERLNVDTSHFIGSGWNAGRVFGPKRPLSAYLAGEAEISSHALRLRLIKEGHFQAQCSGCSLTEWQGHQIPLELDHINGDRRDNRIGNLRLLCPNCHAQTATYGGKNKALKRLKAL